jgi:hypothetical protein
VTVPLGPLDLARRARELQELLAVKAEQWPEPLLDALRSRVAEVETAALDLALAPVRAVRGPGSGAGSPPPPRTPPPTSTPGAR